MNYIKFYLNISIAPIYFTLLLVSGIKDAFVNACVEIRDSYYATKRIYGIK